MRLRATVATSICLVSLLAFLSAQKPPAAGSGFNNVSLIRLIANPGSFDGRHVRIAGYLDKNGIDNAMGLYVSELDGRNFILSNSVDIGVDESVARKVVGKYVILEGTFHAPTGPMAEYLNGRVDPVSRITPWNQGDVQK